MSVNGGFVQGLSMLCAMSLRPAVLPPGAAPTRSHPRGPSHAAASRAGTSPCPQRELRVSWTCWVPGAPPSSRPASIPRDAARVSLPLLEAVEVHPRGGMWSDAVSFFWSCTPRSPLTLAGAAGAYREKRRRHERSLSQQNCSGVSL